MIIKTLEHIHRLLIDDERVACGMKKYAAEEEDKAQRAFDTDPSEKNRAAIESAKAEHERLYKKWEASYAALDDFETQGF